MSAGNAEPASVSSLSELERILSSLAGRIEELESDLSRERARRREIEQRVGKQEDRYSLILDDILALEDAVDVQIETMAPRHRKMWMVYRGGKWLLGAIIAGRVTLEVTGLL